MDDFSEFYDSIANEYDEMTSDAGRWDNERPFLSGLLEEFGWGNVLVAGCGTGGEAIVLAQLGVKVVGVDGSFDLLEIAAEKASQQGVGVEWYHDDIRVLKHPAIRGFNSILC